MKKRYTISIMVSTAAVLAACGGGGGASNSSTPTSKPSFNLTGTVPGTLIEAFCEDGSYHAVNSENDFTTRHPFVLKVPTDLSCRLVMTTNEDDPNNKVVTPIIFTTTGGVSSIAFSGNDDVDLDFIDLALTRDEMNSDANEDGVEDEPTEVNLDDDSIEVIEIENDPLDDDDDDIINMYEDDDDDKIYNRDDDDDDGDGIKDEDDEDHQGDDDGDGIDDDDDVDDDNDGIEDEEDEEDNNVGSVGGSNPDLVTTPSAGRLLASQCAQCHRTDGNPDNGFEDLIGEEIYGDLVEMKRENKRELMHLQANGYTEEQIILIDDYFDNLSANRGGE